MNATFRKAAIQAGVPLDTMRKLVVAAREDHLDLVADSAECRWCGARKWSHEDVSACDALAALCEYIVEAK